MIQWWNSLTMLQQILAYVAIPATVILLLQTIMLLFGFGGDNDADVDADIDIDDPSALDHDGGIDGLRLFTVRGFVAFLAVGGWLGLSISRAGASDVWSLIGALLGGAVALFVVAFFFKWAMSLQADGSVETSSAVGEIGEVYIRIPANRNGRGKITILLGGALTELDAITDIDRDITPREQVKVEKAEGTTLVVTPVKE